MAAAHFFESWYCTYQITKCHFPGEGSRDCDITVVLISKPVMWSLTSSLVLCHRLWRSSP